MTLTSTPTSSTGSSTGSSPSRPELVLASGSPRRRELLSRLGLAFTVRPADLDETPRPGEGPEDYVLRLAREKATVQGEPGELVLAADTVVAQDGELLGKPEDDDDARRMLRQLAGREHAVFTGVALWDPATDRLESGVEETLVRFAELSESEIAWYVDSGEPLDKAGAYAIQELGVLFVEGIVGNHSNVVGLPLPRVYRMLEGMGFNLRT